MKTSAEYRMESRAALNGHWPTAVGMFFVMSLIFGVLAGTFIGTLLLGGALTMGLAYAMCHLLRTNTLQFEDMFAGFRHPNFAATVGVYFKSALFAFLWSLLFVIPGIVASYSYAMAPYILNDHPEMTSSEAITASKNLMAGKKWNLFCLQFSFIGWILLCVLTFGIATLWVAPWMNAAEAAFYESIKYEVPGTIVQ